MNKGVLYLLPTTLGDSDLSAVLPVLNQKIAISLRYFIVEELRTARRFLKKVDAIAITFCDRDLVHDYDHYYGNRCNQNN